MNSTYFDHNATTALDSRVLDVMLPWMQTQSGNPTSRHFFGRDARNAIEHARAQVAEACGTYSSQVIFTSSGTEANNFAIKGLVRNSSKSLPMQILTSEIEHPCISRPALAMQEYGYLNHSILVDQGGKVDLAKLQAQLAKPTDLLSVMMANNETGVIQEIATIAEMARMAGALMHTDAVQALGKIPLSFQDLNVHAMTVSSHKIHGPQGAAALILDKKLDIKPLLHGGGQEKGLRSGTENVAAIAGFGAACELAVILQSQFFMHTKTLRDRFEHGLMQLNSIINITIFGNQVARLPNTSFFSVDNIEGETLVMGLDKLGYAVASGSACSSDSSEPSHVLLAMGIEKYTARGAVRISFGINNTSEQVDHFLVALYDEVLRLKQLTSVAA